MEHIFTFYIHDFSFNMQDKSTPGFPEWIIAVIVLAVLMVGVIAGLAAALVLLRRKKKQDSSRREASVSYLNTAGETVVSESSSQNPPAIYDEIQEPHLEMHPPNTEVVEQEKQAGEYQNAEFHSDAKYQALGPIDTPISAYEGVGGQLVSR